jgi:uncharacterized membrane-anchored protein
MGRNLAVFKGNKEKIKLEKEEWMKEETETWEEQYTLAKLKIRMAIDDYYVAQECCQRN